MSNAGLVKNLLVLSEGSLNAPRVWCHLELAALSLNTATFFCSAVAGMERSVEWRSESWAVEMKSGMFPFCWCLSSVLQSWSSVCHAFSIHHSLHSQHKEKSCAARHLLCYHGDPQQCHQQPMAALSAPPFKWGSHTSHKWRLREKWVSGAW